MKLKPLVLILVTSATFLVVSLVFSETYSDLIRQEREEFEKEVMSDSWEFYKEKEKDFKEFKDERDRDFAEFLKAQWEIVEFEKPFEIIDKPKPKKLPVAKLPVFPDQIKRPVHIEEIPPEKVVKPEPIPEYVPPPPPVITKEEKREEVKGVPLQFNFFGSEVYLRYDPKMKTIIDAPIDNNAISSYWAAMARSDFDLLLGQTFQYRNELLLNDWGYYVFLDRVGAEVVGNNNNEKNLFVWFMLSKSGYETKVGYRKDKIFLFMPATTNLYGLSFYTLDRKRYYAVSTNYKGGRLGKIFTYKGKYPGADRSMDFLLRQYPKLTGKLTQKELSFYFEGEKHTLHVALQENSIPFFEYHPQTDVRLYAMAPLPPWLGSSLLQDLSPMIQGKNEKEAINLLLRLTQTTFQYKTDQVQFGREKVMFPEETVFYPYSDCEDRSIFFSYLVRNLLGLDVVLVNYPNHIATAVLLKGGAVGDQVMVNGKPYTVCDPTYINAVLGMAMPQFKGVTPKVIMI